MLHAGIDGTKKEPAHAAVKHGLAWLISIQDHDGCFGWRIDNRFTYGQAIDKLVLCEALTATGDEAYRKPAQAGLQFIAQCRNPGTAWRYGVRPGDSDSSVTGWMLRALVAGRDAGLQIDHAALTDGLNYLDFLTNPETGRTGYIYAGELPVRPEGLVKAFPAAYSESLTAMAVFCRINCLSDDEKQRRFLGPASTLIARNLPRWEPKMETIDFYYWYYGTLASYQIGKDAWAQWDTALRKAATAGVRKAGCMKGSLDPTDPWGQEGGRIYSTALMALSLEVPYQSVRRLK